MVNRPPRNCRDCNIEFPNSHNTNRTQCDKCRYLIVAAKRPKKLPKRNTSTCEQCNNVMILTPSRSKIRRFCSLGCYGKYSGNKREFWSKANYEQKIERIKILLERLTIFPNNPNDCYSWSGSTSKIKNQNYGKMTADNKFLSAHRASYMVNIGEIPKGMSVLHTCDNPPCTNPSHLYLGTTKENCADKIKKGRARYAFGETKKDAKLTDEKVIEIKKELEKGTFYKELAKRFSVSITAIHRIKNKTKWKHVTID